MSDRRRRPKHKARTEFLRDQAEVMRLHLACLRNHEVAAKLGISERTVERHIAEIRERWRAERDELAAHACDKDLNAMVADEQRFRRQIDALGDDPDSVELAAKLYDRVAKIAERRAKLLGLDAPTRHEISGARDDAPPLVIRLVWPAGELQTPDPPKAT